MKQIRITLLAGTMMLLTAAASGRSFQAIPSETVAATTDDIDTTYIKLDENFEPINYVHLTYDELAEKVGELETILETDAFQLYAGGDYTYKVEGGVVTSMAIQIEDAKNDKVIYNRILNALARSKPVKDIHNTGGNYYLYGNFQVQFDDFEGYEKLTFSVIPD